MAERDLDVAVFGATGITGRRVAEYLAGRADEAGLRWAAVARDTAKAERLLAEAGAEAPELIAADLEAPGSLAAMAARARVVLNLAGPYTLYGEPVIRACIEGGAHYADLTGEIPFVRRTQRAYDERAREAGVKVVQVCGFEALPPDLGVALAAEAGAERWGEELSEVDLEVRVLQQPSPPRPSDLISGGTFQSLAAAAGDPDSAVITDPGCLIDDPAAAAAVKSRSPIKLAPRRGPGGSVVAPMSPAAFINPAVIHRSAFLRAQGAGTAFQPFVYREGAAFGGGAASLPLRFAAASMVSGMQGAARAVATAGPAVRGRASRALSRLLPSSGAGPKADRLEPWRWRMDIRARTPGGSEIAVQIDADGHPGYLATARMLGEAGMLMAEDGATPERGGCLTPAAALGTATAPRFARAGLRFSVA